MKNLSQRLALGTVQFGLPYGIANKIGQVSRTEAREMLQLAQSHGIDTLDTAISYGESEKCLGEIGIDNFRIITKLPMVPSECADIFQWIQEQISASLLRLYVTRLYGLLLHSPDQLFSSKGKVILQALQEAKNSGYVQKIGISIYNPSELDAIFSFFTPDIVQTPFNLLDHRIHATGWLERLKEKGVEIHIRSVFLQGLLLMPRADIPPRFSPWASLWDKWHNWLADMQVSPVSACLSFPLSFPEVDRVVVGADCKKQLLEIITSADQPVNILPDLPCNAENLINPSKWNLL